MFLNAIFIPDCVNILYICYMWNIKFLYTSNKQSMAHDTLIGH
jgi:hypothetical protein